MRRILLFTLMCCIGIMHADAAVRDSKSVSRNQSDDTTNTSVIARNASVPSARAASSNRTSVSQSDTASRGARTTVARSGAPTRGATTQIASVATTTRSARTPASSRSATNTSQVARTASDKSVVRSATPRQSVSSARAARSPRATTIAPSSVTNTFGTEYNICRDAYFTCMDQFCATMNDSYRRCVCSSRLTDVQERERALGQTADQLADFKNLNIEVIPKTAAEVNAMLSASEGELAITEDDSQSAQTLAGINEVLSSTKSQALSTLGTLDIAGDINQIWATTNLASGENIANLTGESLYNAVHSQCVDLIASSCPSQSTLNMVISAYGMYIENDCTTLLNALDSQLVQANSSIRDTEREMNVARLENYNAHNSTAINDCIAQVRTDITAETACGPDYIHCLDITGRYLNRDTGEPIYSPDFYQLEYQISLDGDVLTNATNRLIVSELNSKRIYAARGLETCRDIADEVWDEFVRQAIVEIYQGQQEKIRDVKNECLDVVNTCYDEQSESLKDFSNIKEELLAGSRLELSEELCEEKLYACSNLYGDPNGNGLELLISAMHEITDQKIAKECRALLEAFAQDTCKVPSNDSLHAYPYGCRVYAPGEQIYANRWQCNNISFSYGSSTGGDIVIPGGTEETGPGYICPEYKVYLECNPGYTLFYEQKDASGLITVTTIFGADAANKPGNGCVYCGTLGYEDPETACPGGTASPPVTTTDLDCGPDYAGSLYQKIVRYATQVCVRPSDSEKITNGELEIPAEVMGDVNTVMDTVKVEMANVLSAECERLGGTWFDTQWKSDGTSTGTLYKYFYDETGANTKWGYCAEKESAETATTGL